MIKPEVSTKYSHIEENIVKMLDPLKNDQTFLRMIKYLTPYPLEVEYYDDIGNYFAQPDIPMPYDLIGNEDISLLLFNPKIVTDSKCYLFFSHRKFNSDENNSILAKHIFVFDIVCPYAFSQIQDKIRQDRIADQIFKAIDNQFVGGLNQVFITQGEDYVVNDIYQGLTLQIKVNDERI